MSEHPDQSTAAGPSVPMEAVVRFIRQLSHDLRNHLNAVELQSAYVNELAEDPELKGELKRLRGMLGEIGGSLQRVTSQMMPVKLNLMPYEASLFAQDLEQKTKAQFPEKSTEIDWMIETGSSLLEIDPQILQQAFLELIGNAFQHGRGAGQICASAEIKAGEFVFTLREPKESFSLSTDDWGAPFVKVSHGHYALGLHRARHIIEAHHGRLDARYDQASSSLVTTVALPLADASA